ncbi:MAG: amidohydrolase family protein [Rhizobiales bacterium]|nr:amidohydrolase family protein [Hyphomicrobiales bacterium]
MAPASADVVLRGGEVIDGTGAPRYRADVAISGDRILAIGDLSATTAFRDLDATGLVVSPGFIDAHTHDDRALCETPDMTPKLSQGVTTVVAGNCGISLAPLVLDRFPPPPMHLLGDERFYRFDSFSALAEHLGRDRATVNSAILVGHTTLRHRRFEGSLERPARDGELAAMVADVEEAMAQGAIGLSTGLDYPESIKAPSEEVCALARAAARHGGIYASHTRDYFVDIEGAITEAIDTARDAGLPLVLSHHQVSGAANFGRSVKTLALVADAIARQDVSLDVYPYNASSKTLDPQRCQPGVRVLVTWSDRHPEMAGKEISEVAAIWGTASNIEAAERLIPAGAVYFQLDEADVQRILRFPHAMIGSDGIPFDKFPHPRLWGTFPRVLGHYARELKLFSLEEAVHRMTGLTARNFGLAGRGVVREGAYADLVLFDPATVLDRATFTDPRQTAAGIVEVFVNGMSSWSGGRLTGERAGRVLRREGRPNAGAGLH